MRYYSLASQITTPRLLLRVPSEGDEIAYCEAVAETDPARKQDFVIETGRRFADVGDFTFSLWARILAILLAWLPCIPKLGSIRNDKQERE